MSALSEAELADHRAAHESAALFALPERGLIEVRGGDRIRWLDGMISNHVAVLSPAGDEPGVVSGCYATLLTAKGAIIADFQVMMESDGIWLETARDVVPSVIAHLDKYIIADDVELHDVSESFSQWSLEGPQAASLVGRACGNSIELLAHACRRVSISDASVLVGAFGWGGDEALRLIVARDGQEALRSGLAEAGLLRADGSRAVLEVLRIEAGHPLLGRELDEQVLPDEARLDHAISVTKGCYVGQEIVARLRSRGAVNHLLVGFELGDGPLPADDADVECEGRRTGEVTSSCESPLCGAIALGYVRRQHSEPGTEVSIEGRPGRVVALPFSSASHDGSRGSPGGHAQ